MKALETRHQKIIDDILGQYPYDFYVFGSRAKGTHQKFSDIDLCAMKVIPDIQKSQLHTAFEESNLPFKVDIIEWSKISDDFQRAIKDDFVKIDTLSENK